MGKFNRPGLNHKDSNRSIGWAEFAMVNDDVSDPDSHSCPGKQLSLAILIAFLQEFSAAGPWKADDHAITLNSYSSSGFTLRKFKLPSKSISWSGRARQRIGDAFWHLSAAILM